jgi:Tfp pilus assembly protein PilF
MALSSVDPSSLFSATVTTSAQLDGLQQRSLGRALDLYTSGNYEQAIKEFTRSIGYSPQSDNAIKAFQFIAQSYSNLNDSAGAIKAYTQALKVDPSNADLHVALANIYYYNNNYNDAINQYEAAVKSNPSDSNRYSLGQGYLAAGRLDDAELQFNKVKGLNKNNPAGDYGIGLVYEKKGQYDTAIRYFKNALSIKSNYTEAYSEMGYALADSGRMSEAQQVQSDLALTGSSLASQLQQYIDSKSPPKILYAGSTNFNTQVLGPGTSVAFLSNYQITPNSSQTFSMQFFFSKPMDSASVQNIINWNISRSPNTGPGSGYNYGMPLATTEVNLMPHPLSVYYDDSSQSATVFFSISQNADGTATIDPRHIQFSFSGKDSDGLKADTTADQYAGFSGIA